MSGYAEGGEDSVGRDDAGDLCERLLAEFLPDLSQSRTLTVTQPDTPRNLLA